MLYKMNQTEKTQTENKKLKDFQDKKIRDLQNIVNEFSQITTHVIIHAQPENKKLKDFQDKKIRDLQNIVNEFRKIPQFEKYVDMHQLHLLDGRLKGLDILLEKGLLN